MKQEIISGICSGMFLMIGGLFAFTAQIELDPAQAREVFARARTLSQRDGGKLWGKTLYGPILLVDPQTRRVVANQADASGLLQSLDGLYTGSLPETVIIATSPTQWAGTRWTMLMWPLHGDRLSIDRGAACGHAAELASRQRGRTRVAANGLAGPGRCPVVRRCRAAAVAVGCLCLSRVPPQPICRFVRKRTAVGPDGGYAGVHGAFDGHLGHRFAPAGMRSRG